MHRITNGWRPSRQVANSHTARRPEHYCRPPIPIKARILWADTGEVEWIDTTAGGWSGRLVYVDARPIRPAYRHNNVWLDASDVERI